MVGGGRGGLGGMDGDPLQRPLETPSNQVSILLVDAQATFYGPFHLRSHWHRASWSATLIDSRAPPSLRSFRFSPVSRQVCHRRANPPVPPSRPAQRSAAGRVTAWLNLGGERKEGFAKVWLGTYTSRPVLFWMVWRDGQAFQRQPGTRGVQAIARACGQCPLLTCPRGESGMRRRLATARPSYSLRKSWIENQRLEARQGGGPGVGDQHF